MTAKRATLRQSRPYRGDYEPGQKVIYHHQQIVRKGKVVPVSYLPAMVIGLEHLDDPHRGVSGNSWVSAGGRGFLVARQQFEPLPHGELWAPDKEDTNELHRLAKGDRTPNDENDDEGDHDAGDAPSAGGAPPPEALAMPPLPPPSLPSTPEQQPLLEMAAPLADGEPAEPPASMQDQLPPPPPAPFYLPAGESASFTSGRVQPVRTDSAMTSLCGQPELKKLKLASISACWTGCGTCNPTVYLANDADGSKKFMSRAN